MIRLAVMFLLLLASACRADRRFEPPVRPGFYSPALSDFKLKHGDNPAWADPKLDDSDWEEIDRYDIPARDGIYWVRFRHDLRPSPSARPRDTFVLAIVASYDVYWDGRFLGHSGQVGASAAEEIPGTLDNMFQIPEELGAPGEHIVALRMSSFRTGFPSSTYGIMARAFPLPNYVAYRARSVAFSLIALGAACVVGLVFGLMWLLADRRATTAIFSGACFVAAAQQALQAMRGLVSYPYHWHYPRLLLITLLVGLLGALLVYFLIRFLRVRGAWWRLLVLLGFYIAVWPLSPIYNVKAVSLSWCALIAAAFVAGEAVMRKRPGAAYVLAGLIISFVGTAVSPAEFLEHSYVFTSGAAMLGCIAALTLQWRDDRRAARQAQLTAARLEIELLKKNIQPHFVLNTLATVMEVIEKDPRVAVSLVEALASEFRLLNRVSGETLITLEQELELCHAHLSVMSLRKGARCQLEAIGVAGAALVPPALFLTLVENGLTHLLPREGEIRFELRAQYRGDTAKYTFLAMGQKQPASTAAERPMIGPGEGQKEGTGIRYIKARLEESFTREWRFQSEVHPEGWQTTIEIRGGGATSAPARAAAAAPLS